MSSKIYITIIIVVICLVSLIFAATKSNAKAVVTINELMQKKIINTKVQIGAQVAHDSKIESISSPKRIVKFSIVDRVKKDEEKQILKKNAVNKLQVVYEGIMPDTLRAGRDVIVQGVYDGEVFNAYQLLTQCPSKYEPPKIEEAKIGL